MTRQIFRARQVRQDIIEIYRYVHERNPRAADRLLVAIERSIRSLATTPGIGTLWRSPIAKLARIRFVSVTPYRNYLIFFRPIGTRVEILRVIHGARELSSLIDAIDPQFDDEQGS